MRSLLLGVMALVVTSAVLSASPVQADDDAARAIANLRSDDAAVRRAAVERLAVLLEQSDSALPEVRRALADPDPDVRFNVLFLLHARDVETLRRVRVVVSGINAPSFPAALAAYEDLLVRGNAAMCTVLIQGIPRRIQDAKAQESGRRFACFTLSLIRELVTRKPELATKRLATELATLLEEDLRTGHHELIGAFAAFPEKHTLEVLGEALSSGRALVRARAARVIAEALPAQRAQQVAALLAPLLKHANGGTRLAALRAFDLLALAPGPVASKLLLPVVPLVRDESLAVSVAALRLTGIFRLEVAREGVEAVAADAKASLVRRKRAVVALAKLGTLKSAGLLERLAGQRREEDYGLAELAAWALGCVRAPRARQALEALLGVPTNQDILYRGFARLGGEQGLAALTKRLALVQGVEVKRAPRLHAIKALGFVRDAPQASGHLAQVMAREPVARLSDLGVTGNEIKAAVKALAERDDDAAREALARRLIAPLRSTPTSDLVEQITRVGPPADETVKAQLVSAFGGLARNSPDGRLRIAAVYGLPKLDPQRASEILVDLMRTGRVSARELARALARAGDTSHIDTRALPLSLAELERASAEGRRAQINPIALDLLFANRCPEAILWLRRMVWCDPQDKLGPYNLACGYALMSHREPAIRYLRRSVHLGYGNHTEVGHMRHDGDLDSLHGDVRYQRLIEGLLLSEETGLAPPKYPWPMGD